MRDFGIAFYLGLVAIVLVLVVIIYFFLIPPSGLNPYNAVPHEPLIVFETNDMTGAWEDVTESKIWEHLKSNSYFASINSSVSLVDSIITDNSILKKIFQKRTVIVSTYPLKQELSYLLVSDLQKSSKLEFFQEYLNPIYQQYGYESTIIEYEEEQITYLEDYRNPDNVFYYCIFKNLILASPELKLIQSSIDASETAFLKKDEKRNVIWEKLNDGQKIRILLNYPVLDQYLGNFLRQEELGWFESLLAAFRYTGFGFDIQERKIKLEGYTHPMDSLSGLSGILLDTYPGKFNSYHVMPERTALYMPICFRDFKEFWNRLNDVLKDEPEYLKYRKDLDDFAKKINIDIEEDFISWIGEEMALYLLQPTGSISSPEATLVIETSDIDVARAKLEMITHQVEKHLPVKIKTKNHLNHKIYYLGLKGFFNMFLGKMFAKIEKPYFTIIEEHVIFSNSPTILESIINDYVQGKTLSKRPEFKAFIDELDVKSNINMFMLMPEMFLYLKYYSNSDTRADIEKNKNYILGFKHVGIQFASRGELLKTKMLIDYDESLWLNQQSETLKPEAKISKEYFELLRFQIPVASENLIIDGPMVTHYQSGKTQTEGRIKNGKKSGLWRTYYENGTIKQAVNYYNGKVHGEALFYHHNGIQSARIKFKDAWISGTYKEYYNNANLKASIPYENGRPNGDSEFHFKNGQLKSEGKYKEGKKDGTWKYYDSYGELIKKEKWKKGHLKGT